LFVSTITHKLLNELSHLWKVRHGPRKKQLHFGGNRDLDPDPRIVLRNFYHFWPGLWVLFGESNLGLIIITLTIIIIIMGRPFLNSVVLCDLDLWLFCSKIRASFTCMRENISTTFEVCMYELISGLIGQNGTDRQTCGTYGGTATSIP